MLQQKALNNFILVTKPSFLKVDNYLFTDPEGMEGLVGLVV